MLCITILVSGLQDIILNVNWTCKRILGLFLACTGPKAVLFSYTVTTVLFVYPWLQDGAGRLSHVCEGNLPMSPA